MAGSFCRKEPAAALRGFLNGFLPSFSCSAETLVKTSFGIYTSPRTSKNAGAFFSCFGMSLMVRRFSVTSSPTSPSPRVEPRTNTPSRYSRLTESPSILDSTTKTVPGCCSCTRRTKSSTSSNENTSCRLSMRTACGTLVNTAEAAASMRWVGESAVTSCGNCCSSARSSCVSWSYSKSSSSGASWL